MEHAPELHLSDNQLLAHRRRVSRERELQSQSKNFCDAAETADKVKENDEDN